MALVTQISALWILDMVRYPVVRRVGLLRDNNQLHEGVPVRPDTPVAHHVDLQTVTIRDPHDFAFYRAGISIHLDVRHTEEDLLRLQY